MQRESIGNRETNWYTFHKMRTKISKKLFLVLLGIFLLILALGSALLEWGNLDWIKLDWLKGKKTDSSAKVEKEAEPEKIETADWQDPAGFSFSYNKILKIDDHPENEVNYAYLELTAPDKKGTIKIMVNDSEYSDLAEWFQNDKNVKDGNAIDTNIAGLPAKKVSLSGTEPKIVTAFMDADQVIYLIELKSEDEERFWQPNYDLILSSFKLIPLEGEQEGSLRLLEIEVGEEEGGGEVIVEEEEVIE